MEEAVEWVKRCPNPPTGEAEIEIRPVFEAEDFGEEFTPELRAQEEALRERAAKHGARPMVAAETTRAIDAVWRIESAKADRRRSPASSATSGWPRSWRRTRSSPRSSSGRVGASRTTRAPG